MQRAAAAGVCATACALTNPPAPFCAAPPAAVLIASMVTSGSTSPLLCDSSCSKPVMSLSSAPCLRRLRVRCSINSCDGGEEEGAEDEEDEEDEEEDEEEDAELEGDDSASPAPADEDEVAESDCARCITTATFLPGGLNCFDLPLLRSKLGPGGGFAAAAARVVEEEADTETEAEGPEEMVEAKAAERFAVTNCGSSAAAAAIGAGGAAAAAALSMSISSSGIGSGSAWCLLLRAPLAPDDAGDRV